jgi:hypothetical protein
MNETDRYITVLARVIASLHGNAVDTDNETVAERNGYDSFIKYTDDHYQEYIKAAETVYNIIIQDCVGALKEKLNERA